MKLVKIAVAALNQTPLDWDGNRSRILRAIDLAREQGATLLCLPELCVTGYGCEDNFHSGFLLKSAEAELSVIAEATRGIAVSVGLPISHKGAVFNTACLIVDGSPRGFVAKKHLAGDGIHYEPRWFRPWPHGTIGTVTVNGSEHPIGDIHFDIGGIGVGFEICEDAWVADRPGRELALKGVDIILNPSASHFAFGKKSIRRQFVMEGARAFNVSYAYANLLGCEAGRIIYDGDCLIASAGRIAVETPRFSFEEVVVRSAYVDVGLTRTMRARSGSTRPTVARDPSCIQCPGFTLASSEYSPSSMVSDPPAWEVSPYLKEEELTRAVCLGLFDYLRRCGAKGFTVSLSGGADSSTVSCLVAKMIELAIHELGSDRFLRAFPKIESLRIGDGLFDLTGKLLCCVYQRTRNNSETTRTAAREVAKAIGATFLELDIDEQVDGYVDLVSRALGRKLEWSSDDLALQNVQARVRVPGVWLIANCNGSLLLTCSNRSEAAVGYATMDGDTAGGLNPIGGIDKAFLRRWLGWLEEIGPQGLSRVSALRYVTSQEPTAELRPLERGQTDEKDLMPYSILNRVELLAVRDKKSPLEVYRILAEDSKAQYDKRQCASWIERFFRLWSVNQWKRERYAPCFHLDDENLDPKTWCRFPILSSGFERELAELAAVVGAEG